MSSFWNFHRTRLPLPCLVKLIKRLHIMVNSALIINSWPLWMSRWLTAGCTRALRPTKLGRSVSGNLSHSCSVSKYENKSVTFLLCFKIWEQVSANFTITVETTTLAGVHQGVKTLRDCPTCDCGPPTCDQLSSDVWWKTYNMWQTPSDLWSTTSRFFFFTAFSTRGGGCDPRNDWLPTWSSPPCPCSSPKVAQVLDSCAHQQYNPLLYYI